MTPYLVEEELERVGGVRCQLVARDARGGDDLAPAVVGDVEPAAIDLVLELTDRFVVEVELLDQLAELGQVDAARLLADLEERADSGLVDDRFRGHRFLGPCGDQPAICGSGGPGSGVGPGRSGLSGKAGPSGCGAGSGSRPGGASGAAGWGGGSVGGGWGSGAGL